MQIIATGAAIDYIQVFYNMQLLNAAPLAVYDVFKTGFFGNFVIVRQARVRSYTTLEEDKNGERYPTKGQSLRINGLGAVLWECELLVKIQCDISLRQP